MSKKIKSYGLVGIDERTTAEKVFDLVKNAYVQDVIDLLMADYVMQPNDATTRNNIENFLNEIFEGRYLIRCSMLENTTEMIDNNLIGIRFVGIDEDFTLQLQFLPRQLELSLDLFLTTHLHSIK